MSHFLLDTSDWNHVKLIWQFNFCICHYYVQLHCVNDQKRKKTLIKTAIQLTRKSIQTHAQQEGRSENKTWWKDFPCKGFLFQPAVLFKEVQLWNLISRPPANSSTKQHERKKQTVEESLTCNWVFIELLLKLIHPSQSFYWEIISEVF